MKECIDNERHQKNQNDIWKYAVTEQRNSYYRHFRKLSRLDFVNTFIRV